MACSPAWPVAVTTAPSTASVSHRAATCIHRWRVRFRVAVARLARRCALLLAFAAAGAAQAQVVELAGRDLPAYLQAHEKVMVLFTTSDPACVYCVDADQGFAQAARRLADAGWRYVVVRWMPWNQVPPEVRALGVSAIPQRWAFVRGKFAGWIQGRVRDIDLLVQRMHGLQASVHVPSPSPAVPTKALARATPPYREAARPSVGLVVPMRMEWVRAQAQHQYLKALYQHCTQLHPGEAEAMLKPMIEYWERRIAPVAFEPTQSAWLRVPEGVEAVASQRAWLQRNLREHTGLRLEDVLTLDECRTLLTAATRLGPSWPTAHLGH
jgi:hypothetical protein